ncbi:hypothetical protein [Frigoribacterium sp. VKM Ac-2530]|uniref:hypothetical protein n=1 Tax=Frigoribacterium sp. VKM Ac-2530 TaxID=2783822 RepID=UPI00188B72A3|nr:hypothetical protein [Frigoribacterium sp. VKM Ac-2530]MBF4578620.1 hypothetical protein [Frigoribacterium sp. VKM Ac-2530]
MTDLLDRAAAPGARRDEEVRRTVPGRVARTARVARTSEAVRTHLTPARLVMAVAVALCLASLPAIPEARHTTFGLLLSTVPGVPASIALSAVAAVLALRGRRASDRVLALAVSLACLRLPTALGTAEPIYGWTYKHLGVIDWVQQHGSVATGVDIYGGWPGAFSAVAWFCTVTGTTPIALAQWFAVLVQAFAVLAVFSLARGLGQTHRQAFVAAFLAQALGWVGQDYLSPQAVGWVLALGVLVLLVHSRRRPALGLLAVVPFAAVVVTHQLTPYWLVLAALALGALGVVRPRWLGLAFALAAGGWLLLHTADLGSSALFSGADPLANARTPQTGAGSTGQTVTSLAARGTAVALWALAGGVAGHGVLAGRLRRRASRVVDRRLDPRAVAPRQHLLVAAVLAFAPFGLLAGQSYGGEALFRVYLYSLPGCVVLVAPLVTRLLVPRAPGAPRAVVPLVAAVLVVAAALGSAQAYYGGWFANVVQPRAVEVGSELLRTMPVPSRLLSPVPVGPGRMVGEYVAQAAADPLYDASMTTWEGWLGESFDDPAVERDLTSDLVFEGEPTYLLLTQQMRDYGDLYGLYPEGALDRFADQLDADDRWTSVVDDGGVQLWVLEGTSPAAPDRQDRS